MERGGALRVWWALCLAAVAWGHDAPAQVTIHVHVRPVGNVMRVLARIPLEAVRDVQFPEVTGGFLDVAATAPRLEGLAKLWVADRIFLFEEGVAAGPPRIVSTQISMESDRSFATYAQADAHVREPLPGNDLQLYWKQVFFDVAVEYPIRNAESKFSIRPGLADLGERVTTVIHSDAHTYVVTGDTESIPLEPSWGQAGWLFLRMGFVHILEGTDHLLFLLCLVIPFRQFRPLLWAVTAFTAAHSLTLVASVLDMAPGGLWFPPLVEWLIATSIVLMAIGNIVGWAGHRSWMMAFGFGLIHGFGFSFALREQMQFAGSHLAMALLAFNVGVELGQVAALAVMAAAVAALFRYAVEERLGVIVLSALVAHTGLHWMWERWERLEKYSMTPPVLEAAAGALLLQWLLAGMVLWGLWRVTARMRT